MSLSSRIPTSREPAFLRTIGFAGHGTSSMLNCGRGLKRCRGPTGSSGTLPYRKKISPKMLRAIASPFYALASAIALGDFLAALMKGSRIGEIVRESLTIGGWVSMWRPLEIFLYDWWPIRNEALLSDRLAAMPVRIQYLNAKDPDAWKGDWPAGRPRGERARRETHPRAFNQAS